MLEQSLLGTSEVSIITSETKGLCIEAIVWYGHLAHIIRFIWTSYSAHVCHSGPSVYISMTATTARVVWVGG